MDKRLKDYYDGLFSRRKSQKSRSGSLSTGKMNLCPTPCGKISTKCRIYDIFKKCKYRERNTFGGTLEWD